MAYNALKKLTLSDGRTLAYDENGDTSSNVLVIFFHGVMGVGSAMHMQQSLIDYKIHFVAPTLPGWGESSPRPKTVPYAANLLSSMTELISHLKPNREDLHIYVAGGSYGTVPAQILYGSNLDNFPLGRHIKGCMILAPFSPFKHHKDYTKSMTWQNYISIAGPPSQWFPFLPSIVGSAIKSKFSTIEGTTEFLQDFLFSKASAEERAKFAQWEKSEGREPGQFESEMAVNAVASFKNTMAGFAEVAEVIHSDWGFDPAKLDKVQYKSCPLHIVATTEDELGPGMANWLAATYPNAKLEWLEGGHVVAVTELDRLFRELLATGEGALETQVPREVEAY